MRPCFLLGAYQMLVFLIVPTVQNGFPSYDLTGPDYEIDLEKLFTSEKQMKESLSEVTSHTPKACPVVMCKSTKNVSCTHHNLKEIPTNQPPCIEKLDLAYNCIRVIENRAMAAYIHLKSLDLRHNDISFLLPESFYGLKNLRYLNLFYNNLAYVTQAFPVGVFKPLVNLQTLRLSKNNLNLARPGLEYPAKALAPLTSLRSLTMDGLPNPFFSSDFNKLKSLSLLSVSGYLFGDCNMTTLNHKTFRHLSQIQYLYLQSCNIGRIERETFKPLRKLVKLVLTHNEDIGIDSLPNITYGLKNTSTLKYLGLHLIVPRYSLSICLSNESLMEYFPASVEHLDAQENSLEAIGPGIVERLPRALKTLDLSGNNFVFGASVTALHKMQELRSLKLNGRSFVYELPKWFPFQLKTSETNNSILNSCLHSYDKKIPVVLRLPPKLKTLEMVNAGLSYRLSHLTVDENNSLQTLILTFNRFPSLDGPLNGLHSLQHLDLSFCYVEVIKSEFFTNLSSLRSLSLSGNLLGNFFASPDSEMIFWHLKNLIDLDLSFAVIKHLRKNVFHGLNNLKVLYLNRNFITKFDIDISCMGNLQYLDLRNTSISTLKEETRQTVDQVLKKSFRIDMSYTPILCDCSNLKFLKWMVKSKAFDPHFHNYQCNYNNLVNQVITDSYTDALYLLGRKCTSSMSLLLIVATSATFLFVIVGVSICYRFRWNLRYLYHIAYLHYKKENRTRSQEFEFDAFICYANEDQDFVLDVLEQQLQSRGLVVHVHGRDFVAGEYISTNIVGAVRRSRKTLVILTPNMLRSSWCNYEVQMANMEAVHTGRKVLIFLIRDSLPRCRQNIDLFYNIKINTYIDFPSLEDTNEVQMNAMWDKLARDIRS